jgi:hypothetical protein
MGALVGIGLILLWAVGLFFYFLPTVVGYSRKRPNITAIFLVNFFFGWSVIGWVVALVWAISNAAAPAQQNIIIQNSQNFDMPKATHADKMKNLQNLKELLDGGVINQQEFDTQKAKILG